MGINVLSLFGGIETGAQCFKELGISVDNYYSSEINKYSVAVAKYNHPNIIELGDVTELNNDKLKSLPRIDWIIGGFPCQTLSRTGLKTGFKGKSGLFYEYLRIVKWITDNNNSQAKILGENVIMKKEWEDQITNSLRSVVDNIHISKLNSKDFGAQSRGRTFWTNFKVEQPINKSSLLLSDILEKNRLDFKHPSQKRLDFIKRKVEKGFSRGLITNLYIKAPCLVASMYKSLQDHTIQLEDGTIRFIHPVECEKLMNLPINYTKFGDFNGVTKSISDTQRYQQLGNGWDTTVIKHIINHANKSIL